MKIRDLERKTILLQTVNDVTDELTCFVPGSQKSREIFEGNFYGNRNEESFLKSLTRYFAKDVIYHVVLSTSQSGVR